MKKTKKLVFASLMAAIICIATMLIKIPVPQTGGYVNLGDGIIIIAGVILLCNVMDGYKKGMVKEIISLVSLLLICIVVVLIGSGLHSYMQHQIVGVVVAVLLLAVLGIAHHLLGVVFFSAKMLSKLPVVNFANKLLGMIVGALETLVLLWTIYSLIMMFNTGALGQLILQWTKESQLLTYVYQNNMLAPIIGDVIANIPVL